MKGPGPLCLCSLGPAATWQPGACRAGLCLVTRSLRPVLSEDGAFLYFMGWLCGGSREGTQGPCHSAVSHLPCCQHRGDTW